MAYTKQTWQDEPSTATPTSAARFTYMEQGIFDAASVADTAKATADDNAYAISQLGVTYATKQELQSFQQIPTYATTADAEAAISSGDLLDGQVCVILDPS